MLKIIYTVLFISAFILSVFCYWGMFTTSGASNFDEMAGMIPFFSGVLAGILYFIIFLIWIIRLFIKQIKQKPAGKE